MKAKSTRVWLKKAMISRKDRKNDRPALTMAYSDNGKRIIASNGLLLLTQTGDEYRADTFYDGNARHPLPVYGITFPDVTYMLDEYVPHRCNYFAVDAKSLWQAVRRVSNGFTRKDYVEANIEMNTSTLTIRVNKLGYGTLNSIQYGPTVEFSAKVCNNAGSPFVSPYSSHNVKSSKLNLWHVYDAVEGMKHASTIDVAIRPDDPNVFKIADRVAIVMTLFTKH